MPVTGTVSPEDVYLIDDDPSVQKSIVRLLESDSLSVRAFSEPETFLSHMVTNPVRLVVLDIWMEKINGMELLAQLCQKAPETRVIFISGHDDHAAETTVMEAGAFSFFVKPLDNDRFLRSVHRALSHTAT